MFKFIVDDKRRTENGEDAIAYTPESLRSLYKEHYDDCELVIKSSLN